MDDYTQNMKIICFDDRQEDDILVGLPEWRVCLPNLKLQILKQLKLYLWWNHVKMTPNLHASVEIGSISDTTV